MYFVETTNRMQPQPKTPGLLAEPSLYYIMLHCNIYICILLLLFFSFPASHYNILHYTVLYYIAFLRAILYCVIVFYATSPIARAPALSGVYSIRRIPRLAASHFVGYCARLAHCRYQPMSTPLLTRPGDIPPEAVVIQIGRYSVWRASPR